MQRSGGLILAVAVLLAAAPAADNSTLGTPRPAWQYRFDGSLEEAAGADRQPLSPREGKPRYVDATQVPGTVGQAIALGVQPGDAECLLFPTAAPARLGPSYSIEAWVRPTALGEWNRLVLRWGNAPQYAFHLAIHQGRASLYHNPASGKYLFAEGGRLTVGRWHHLAAVAQRDEARPGESKLTVYLNGQAVGTATFDGTIHPAGDERLAIGDSAGGPSPPCRFRGYLDEVTLWDRALSDKEIAAHFAQRADILRTVERKERAHENALRAARLARLRQLGIEAIVFAERAPGRDPSGHYYANFGYSCTDPNYWLHGEDGGGLYRLEAATGEVLPLVEAPRGAVRDPQIDFEAKKALFSYRPNGEHHYHLFEINVDGSGLRQITRGAWDDVEGAYLPDGELVFCSTRAKRYIGCWLAPTATLHRCDRTGGNLRELSSGSFTENTPALLPDGRVLYTRWEYVNRDAVSYHHLWTMNPDGSGPMVFFGNMHPGGVFLDAQPIPASDRIVLIHSPGHGINEHVGFVATLTPKRGPDDRSSLLQISREAVYRDPYPLSQSEFLVARGNQLLVMDAEGRFEALYTSPGLDVQEPRPLVPRLRPPQVAPRSDPAQATGTLVLADVYAGRAMSAVKRGEVKKLLVLEDLPKPVNFHGGGSQPIGHGVTSTLKRVLGVVPVEADGSAAFEVPALRSIYFALLDEKDQSIKQMRSFVTVQPGETVGCVGCHEPRVRSPSDRLRSLQATARPPNWIERIADVPEVLDFPRDLQPILDRHCVRCHNHEQRDGAVCLLGDRGPVFSESYYALFLHWQIKDTSGSPGHGSGRQPGNDRPYTTYSSASPLMTKIAASHYGVQLDPREMRTVRLWIDTGAQYAGTCAALGTGQVGGCWRNNEPIRVMADDWPSTSAARDAIQRRCTGCHGRLLPQHVTDRIPIDPWGDMLSWERPLTRFSRHHIFNLSRPEKSLVLLAPLDRRAGGYAAGELPPPAAVVEDRTRPPRPVVHPVVFRDTADPDYRKILEHLESARAKLEEIKRFDMPGFRPNEHYLREMQRYGVLPQTFDVVRNPIDIYATDQAYWRSLWHHPGPVVANAVDDKRGEEQTSPWWNAWSDAKAEASIRALLDKVDAKRMSKHLFYLSKDPLPFRKANLTLPGHKKSTLDEADNYLAGELQSWGYRVDREAVKVQALRRDTSKPKHAQYSAPHADDPWYTAYNLCAEKRGRQRPEEIVLVVAHKDSQSWIDSPGANDNAIGTCGVLEIARVLAQHAPERTLRFLLCNEEHLPWTSVTAAQNAKKRGDRIVAIFNLDGIGAKTAEDTRAGKKTNVTGFTKPEGERLAQLMAAVNTHFAIGLEQRAVQRPGPGDDDGSFVNAGYPAAVVNIGSWPYGDLNYHAEGDIPERCDVENAALAVRATLVAVLTIDQQP